MSSDGSVGAASRAAVAVTTAAGGDSMTTCEPTGLESEAAPSDDAGGAEAQSVVEVYLCCKS